MEALGQDPATAAPATIGRVQTGGRRLGSGRVLDAGRAAAAACGQIVFCESAASGLSFLLALALLAPTAAWMGAVGGGVATAIARALDYPRPQWKSGLYGYSGVLAGLYLGSLFDPGLPTALALLAAAALSVPLTRLAHQILTPREIPTLALPALCLVWLAGLVLEQGQGPAVPGASTLLLASILAGLGFLLYSRLATLAALAGAAVGVGTSLVLIGRLEAGVLANSIPAAIALGAVFLPCSAPALVVAVLGATAAGAIWWWTAPALGAWGLPPLVAPFSLVVVIALAALRSPAVRRWLPGCPAPLPLGAIGSLERSRASWIRRHRLHRLVESARRVCVLTGAGVSREAGLPDFRSPAGLWNRQSRITLDDFLGSAAAREAYWREEERFFRLVGQAAPATVHRALAALHRQGRISAVVTQNVDGLHQAAGVPAEAVIELHGTIHRAQCVDCGLAVSRDALSARIADGGGPLYCDRCQGLLKGGSVMFGEEVAPDRLDAALRALLASDLLLVLGTSLAVAPASDLLRWARDAGIPVAIVNATPTPYDAHAAVTVTAEVGAIALELLEYAGSRRRPAATARASAPPRDAAP